MILAAVVILMILRLSGKGPEPISESFLAMDTVMTVTAYGDGATEALSFSKDRVLQLEKEFSVTDPESEVSRINREGGEYKASDDMVYITSEALKVSRKTGGALDITLLPVTKAWGFTEGSYRVPSETEIQELLKNVGYEKIELDPKTGIIGIPDGTMIDFGAVAKGYAGDEIIGILKGKGVTSAIASLGGSVSVLGTKPDGTEWRVAVKAPDGSGIVGVLSLSDKAVVTSGNSERFFEDESGNRYWHIMDRRTGYPAQSGTDSITIIADSALYADCLSTALFVMGREQAEDYWAEHDDFEFVEVIGKELFVTEGIAPSFKSEPGYTVNIIRR